MSPHIRVLPESVVNKIAAGEVVEHPASVVKELVENAIDAAAGRITVEVKGGGLKLIRVTDDGCGMTRDGLLLSLERHSTSKIETAEDLLTISTLGFRGEAVPSIAAVSKMRITSRTSDEAAGWTVEIRGGNVRRLSERASPQGTTVEVKDLFFNTPVRKDYLGSTASEVRKIGEIMQRYILSHPEIAFAFSHNNREMGRSSGNGDLRENVAAIFGREALDDIVVLENRPGEKGLYDLFGYISRPGLTRSTFRYFYFFINNRYVESKDLKQAVMDGYHTLLPKGRFPLGVLFLQMDPATINQNVHPTKQEVRFLHAGEVITHFSRSVSEVLRESPSTVPLVSEHIHDQQRVEVKRELPPVHQPDLFSSLSQGKDEPVLDVRKIINESAKKNAAGGRGDYDVTDTQTIDITTLHPVGQVFGTYIVVEANKELILVDQHAAHERVLYEQLMHQHSDDSLPSQGLLFPVVIDIKKSDIPLLKKHRFKLERLGIILEHFGGESYLVKALPTVLGRFTARDDVHDVIDDLLHSLYVKSILELKEKLLTLSACRSAVKAGDTMVREEMCALLEDLMKVSTPATCPHGRPTMVSVSRDFLEKRFLRK